MLCKVEETLIFLSLTCGEYIHTHTSCTWSQPPDCWVAVRTNITATKLLYKLDPDLRHNTYI